MMREAEAMALLVMTRGLGYARREAAVAAAGSALALISEPGAYRAALGEEGLASLRTTVSRAQQMLEHLAQSGTQILARTDEGYPSRLAATARPPHVLFVQGSMRLDDAFPFAVVGTRRASEYGLEQTHAIARDLARSGVCIISGLALGVDAAAHMGALDAGGRTIAVLGGAHDRFYPAENRALRERILSCGGTVITEYPPGMPPTSWSFLERNRIIAGLSLGVLVTEGARRSGAQRTVREALCEGREVFALPGRVDWVCAQLPNRLIAEGAHLTTCAADILRMLVIEPPRSPAQMERMTPAAPVKKRKEPRMIPDELGEDERAVYAALLEGEMDFDALAGKTGLAEDALGAALAMLELGGYAAALGGCRYALTPEDEA